MNSKSHGGSLPSSWNSCNANFQNSPTFSYHVTKLIKLMLDDVIGGQQIQTQQLTNIMGSSALNSNKTSRVIFSSSSHRDINIETLENLVEELQRNSSHETTSLSLNISHTLSSTPQTHTPPPNRFLVRRRGSGSHAEPRGVRMGWCQYYKYMKNTPHPESRMY